MTKPTLQSSTPGSDEKALVSAAQRNPAEFTVLYDRYFRRIYRYLYSRVVSVTDAEDLTSQTFLAAFEALPHYHHHGYFSAWLFTIARYKAMDHFRHKAAEISLDESHPDKAEDPLDLAIHSDQMKQIVDLVNNLDEEGQELIRLRCVADLSFAEIGAALGRKEDTVKKAYYRLVSRLQHELEVQLD